MTSASAVEEILCNVALTWYEVESSELSKNDSKVIGTNKIVIIRPIQAMYLVCCSNFVDNIFIRDRIQKR